MLKHPELGAKAEALYRKACGKSPDAFQWLTVFDEYWEDVTRFVTDKSQHNPEAFVGKLARVNTTHSLPYWIRQGHYLYNAEQRAWQGFSVWSAWRNSPVDWRRQIAEVEQMGIVHVVLAVATLEVGPVDAQGLVPELMELAWALRPVTA